MNPATSSSATSKVAAFPDLTARILSGTQHIVAGGRTFVWRGRSFSADNIRSLTYACGECGEVFKETPERLARLLTEHAASPCTTDAA